jgi:hypothetical protein
MKIIPLTLLIGCALTTLALSCKKSNNKPKPIIPPASIVGKWSFVHDSISQITNGVVVPSRANYTYVNGEYMKFNSDGTGNYYSYYSNVPFTYKIKEDTVLTIMSAAYVVYGDPVPAITTVPIIQQLTATKLRLYYLETGTGPTSFHEFQYLSR